MKRYKLIISYDGTRYHGWQKQPGEATIQGVLESAFSRLFGEEAPVTGSGRTDAGVHAIGQVAHVDLTTKIGPPELRAALNSQLPGDIRVRHMAEVPSGFHARYSAVRRTYVYLIHQAPDPSPFLVHYAYHVPFPLDRGAMKDAANRLTGTHDFSAFRATGGGHTLPVRTVFRSEMMSVRGDFLCYLVAADAFLRKMVRGIVGTLLEIGRGKFSPERVTKLLETGDRTLLGPLAPPQGLYLTAVSYAEDFMDMEGTFR